MQAICLAVIVAVASLLLADPWASAATPSCPNGATMTVVAHEDDSLLSRSRIFCTTSRAVDACAPSS